ncbi:MAG: hypothetical protein ACI97A_000793 [Planctomycetota bacterium]|jgi:hypothetical protein
MNLIFVYNAKSGKLSAALDIAHKILSPSTYACALCSLTHDALSEKSIWSEFRKTTGHQFTFLHKDEFESQYAQRFDYPVILDAEADLAVVLTRETLERLDSVDDLIQAVESIDA